LAVLLVNFEYNLNINMTQSSDARVEKYEYVEQNEVFYTVIEPVSEILLMYIYNVSITVVLKNKKIQTWTDK